MGNIGASSYASYIQAGFVASDSPDVDYNLLLQPNGGNVGIGTDSPSHTLQVAGNISLGTYASGSQARFILYNPVDQSYGTLEHTGSDLRLTSTYGSSGGYDPITFYNGGSERLRIDSSGNLLVGTTAVNPQTRASGEGVQLSPDFIGVGRYQNPSLYLNRQSNDGDIAVFRKDGSTVGSIGTASSYLFIGGSSNGKGIKFVGNAVQPCNNAGADNDNDQDLGGSSARWDDIYAANGTIITSDRNEKQDIEALTDAETRVAVAAKGLLRKFRWQSAVEEKGDEARIHFGIIAQDLQDAFTAEGLDAGDYAMFISTTWTNDDGEEQTRLGVRYSELLAFIIAAI